VRSTFRGGWEETVLIAERGGLPSRSPSIQNSSEEMKGRGGSQRKKGKRRVPLNVSGPSGNRGRRKFWARKKRKGKTSRGRLTREGTSRSDGEKGKTLFRKGRKNDFIRGRKPKSFWGRESSDFEGERRGGSLINDHDLYPMTWLSC